MCKKIIFQKIMKGSNSKVQDNVFMLKHKNKYVI